MSVVEISASNKLLAPFSEPVAIAGGKNIKRIRKFIPLMQNSVPGGYIFRLKVESEGTVILHEVGFEVSRIG